MHGNHLYEAYARNPFYFNREEVAPSLGDVYNIVLPTAWSPISH